jgi:hypothetical protein
MRISQLEFRVVFSLGILAFTKYWWIPQHTAPKCCCHPTKFLSVQDRQVVGEGWGVGWGFQPSMAQCFICQKVYLVPMKLASIPGCMYMSPGNINKSQIYSPWVHENECLSLGEFYPLSLNRHYEDVGVGLVGATALTSDLGGSPVKRHRWFLG